MQAELAEPRYVVEAENGAVSGRCDLGTAERIRDLWEARGISAGIDPVVGGVPE